MVHSVDVSKGMMTVSYEVDEGASDLQEMDYYSRDLLGSSSPVRSRRRSL